MKKWLGQRPWIHWVILLCIFAGFYVMGQWVSDAWQNRHANDFSSARLVDTFPATEAPVYREKSGIHVRLVLAGTRYDPDAHRVILPTGSRFQLEIQSERAGGLSVFAINALGQSGPILWQHNLFANQSVLSPMLRLEGTQGLETLQIHLIPDNGEASKLRQISLWHTNGS